MIPGFTRNYQHGETRPSGETMSTALRLALLFIVLGCLYLFLAQPYWFPAGASSQSAAIDHQFRIAFYVLGVMFVAGHLVMAFVLANEPKADDKVLRGGWKVEVAWTVAITAIFFWLHISGNHLSMHAKTVVRVISPREIEVTGAQFEWYFRYPGTDGMFGRTNAQKFARPDEGNPLGIDPADPAGRDDIVSSSLIVPVGQPVVMRLKAQDVIHSSLYSRHASSKMLLRNGYPYELYTSTDWYV